MTTEVLVLNEANHGLIAICKDVPTAIDFLVNECWLTEDTQVWDDDKHDWVFIKELLGENWQINLKLMMAHELTDLFEDWLYFDWVPVKGT